MPSPFAVRLLAGMILGSALLVSLPALAQDPLLLRYKFAVGQTLRYKVTLDPLFENPAGSLQLTDEKTLQGKPIIRILTADVEAVGPDGTATVQMSALPAAEAGQDAETAKAETGTLEISPLGQVLSDTAPRTGLAWAFFRLPFESVLPGDRWTGNAYRGHQIPRAVSALTLTQMSDDDSLAIITQTMPPLVTTQETQTHDGMLVDTMRRVQSDRIVFDVAAGNLLKQTTTLQVSLALKMTNRGWRVRSDFGHVIPVTNLTLFATLYRMDGPPLP